MAIFDNGLGWIFGFEEILLEDCLGSLATGVVLEGGGRGAVHCATYWPAVSQLNCDLLVSTCLSYVQMGKLKQITKIASWVEAINLQYI